MYLLFVYYTLFWIANEFIKILRKNKGKRVLEVFTLKLKTY